MPDVYYIEIYIYHNSQHLYVAYISYTLYFISMYTSFYMPYSTHSKIICLFLITVR